MRPGHVPVAPPRFRAALGVLVGVLVAAVVACSDPPPDDPSPAGPPEAAGTPEASATDEALTPGGWDRELVFIELGADSALFLPWHFRALDAGAELHWQRSLRIGSPTGWEVLHADTLVSPRTRAPWRILAGGPVQMVVEADDALSTLIFQGTERQLEFGPVEFLVEWSRPEGGAARIHRGSGIQIDETDVEALREFDGLILDLTRAWSENRPPPGDWIFLQAGTPTQFVFEELDPAEGGPGRYRGWSRIAFQTRTWPRLEVEWEEQRAFERARRDIPRRWSIRSPDGALEGELEAVGSLLEAGQGTGPLLPVTAYFEVTGDVRVDGELIPVHGLIRHVQQ